MLIKLKDLLRDTGNKFTKYLRDTNYTIITERNFCHACINYAISILREAFFVRPGTTSEPFRIRYSPKNHTDLVIQKPSSRNKPNRINQAQSLPDPPVHINTDSLSLSLSLSLSTLLYARELLKLINSSSVDYSGSYHTPTPLFFFLFFFSSASWVA